MDKMTETSNYPLWQVDQAEKAISAGNIEDAGLMMYSAIETTMIGLAQRRNLPHADHDDLLPPGHNPGRRTRTRMVSLRAV